MIVLQNVAYAHPNKDVLFEHLNLNINKQEKIALIGNNGVGKSTLLRIIAGILQPCQGIVTTSSSPYYIPQLFGQFNEISIAEALQVSGKLRALAAILNGDVTASNLTTLNDDWSIEERCREALSHWGLAGINLFEKMDLLSGGQKTMVFLAGIAIHKPQVVLLDEPTNHLDAQGRNKLYSYIQSTTNTLVVVSHDRTLLNLLNNVCELSKRGMTAYGGNYEFYATQKALEENAKLEDLQNQEKELRKAREVARATIERQQKLDARGRKKQEHAGIPAIAMNTLRNNAEKSTSKIKQVHADKIGAIAEEVNQLRKTMADNDKMKIGFNDAALHKGKILVTAKDVNHHYAGSLLWQSTLSFEIISGRRTVITGSNGSGKTTLLKMLLGHLHPTHGTVTAAATNTLYIDQEYSVVDDRLTVYEQAQRFNTGNLQAHEVKSRLTHFLFAAADWNKLCGVLSGGEKMRLILCCLTIVAEAPDMIILDEPTNNLDIRNTDILSHAVNEYTGTLIVVSHDAFFLGQIGINEEIVLK